MQRTQSLSGVVRCFSLQRICRCGS